MGDAFSFEAWVRALLMQSQTLPESAAAPTCQTCHMQEGNHSVNSPWGFLAVRLPLPQDKQWADDRTTILKAVGVLDPAGKPTPRFDVMKQMDVFRTTEADWRRERDKMIKTCNQCHSINFVLEELQKGDDIIRQADRLMAKAINIVADLYKDGLLQKPKHYAYPFPDLLTFHDAPTPIETKLFVMLLSTACGLSRGRSTRIRTIRSGTDGARCNGTSQKSSTWPKSWDDSTNQSG